MTLDEWDSDSNGGNRRRDVALVRRRAIDAVRACLDEIGHLAFDRRSLSAEPTPGELETTAPVDADGS